MTSKYVLKRICNFVIQAKTIDSERVDDFKGNAPICAIYGYSNNPGAPQGISVYKLPGFIADQRDATKKVSKERRKL